MEPQKRASTGITRPKKEVVQKNFGDKKMIQFDIHTFDRTLRLVGHNGWNEDWWAPSDEIGGDLIINPEMYMIDMKTGDVFWLIGWYPSVGVITLLTYDMNEMITMKETDDRYEWEITDEQY